MFDFVRNERSPALNAGSKFKIKCGFVSVEVLQEAAAPNTLTTKPKRCIYASIFEAMEQTGCTTESVEG